MGLECPNAWRPGLGQQPSSAGQEAWRPWPAVGERQATTDRGHGGKREDEHYAPRA